MTSLISTTSLLLVLFSTVAQHGAASLSGNYGVAATSAGGSSGGRSNFGRRLADEPTPTYKPSVTYSPTIPGEFAFGGDDEFNYDYNYNDDIDGPSAELQETSATATSGNIDEDEVVAPVPSPKTDNVPAPAGPGGDDESDTPPPALKCSFCEEGMPDLELVPPDAGGKNCAEVKGVADENLDGTDVCTKFIQPVQSACCPQSLPSVGDGVPPAVGGAGVAEEEEVTVTTTTPAGDGGEDNAEVPTTPTPEIIGGEANAFVEDQGNAENTTATTAATATPSAASQANTSTATPVAISLGECIQSAENEGKDDPLFTCCATHPDEELCILNSCMDFESGVITCQCKKVKGIGSEIFHGNDPTMAGFLPEDFDDFLDTFRKCCPSKVTSPSEFNDCYYDEISEEIMEEIEKEFEERPTFKPTPRPSSAYTPKSDDEDPVSKEGAEDFSNGQKDDSFQGVVNAYLDGVESPDEMKSDKNVQVVAVSLVVVFFGASATDSSLGDGTP